ncbi:hypothetical protein FQR65_LT12559 [Abscondita terminalis]|nr:hypothetical protein FQR65_LT12559 [Abscondita terminalis]
MDNNMSGGVLVITERLPFEVEKNDGGGLSRKPRFDKVSAVVAGAVDDDCLWLGWPGLEGGTVPEQSDALRVIPVRIDVATFAAHSDFCAILRDLMHLFPSKLFFKESDWKAYRNVNKAFGEQALDVLKTIESDATVWIHDYQMLLVAVPIRQAVTDEQIACKLGFFLHTSFPPWDVVKFLPALDELLQGFLANDVIGFQTLSDCRNFLSSCWHCLGCRVDNDHFMIEHGGRIINAASLTVGIAFDHLAQQPPPTRHSQKIITSFDRCVESIFQKLGALDLLLQHNPAHTGNVTLLLVITHVSKDQIQDSIDEFNSTHCSGSWYPVHATYGYKTRTQLSAILQTADVCIVAPFHQSISLIAKEYVAYQNYEVPGVLVVSSFSRNAETMPETIRVNPHSSSELAQSLHRALIMPDNEKIVRMGCLRKREQRNGVNHWKKTFLNLVRNHTNTGMGEISSDYFEKYFAKWIQPSNDVVLLLDYDGTLAPIMPHPDLSVIPKETKALLRRLCATPQCYVAVISGRGVDNVMEMVGVEEITYAGNHGLEILFPDGSKFAYPIPEGVCERLEKLDRTLQHLCKDGAWIENKGTSLTFHYRDGPLDFRKGFESKAKALIEEAGFKPEHAHLAVEAKPVVQWNKGRAALYILEKVYGTNWADKINVIYAGDDVTDEDALSILRGVAGTIRVTSLTTTKTSAERRVPNYKAVQVMLKWVEHHLSRR